MGVRKLRTCTDCGHDNPDDATKCNSCGVTLKAFTVFSKDHCHERWVCPECSTINMEENKKCSCGYKRGWFS